MSFSPPHPPLQPYPSTTYAPHPSTYDPNTPPPPPPKSHDPNRQETPQNRPPIPAPPGPPQRLLSSSQTLPRPPSFQQQQNITMQQTPSNISQRDESFQDPIVEEEPEEGWLPEILKDISKPDLHHLLTSPPLLHALTTARTTTHPTTLTTLLPLTTLLTANLTLSSTLTSLTTTLQTQRTHTQTHLLHCHSLEHAWRSTQTRLDEVLEPFSPKQLYQRLCLSIGEQEGVCGALEESFLEGGGDIAGDTGGGEREVSEFLKRFREAKKVERLRRERKARWDEGRVGGWR